MGVFLAYAGRFGQALIDRWLYLPRDCVADGARRAKTSVPEDVAFATKPAGCEMIAIALDAHMPCAFVLADTVYGSDSRLRWMLEKRGQGYVLAVRSNHTLRFLTPAGLIETDPATIADDLENEAWMAHAAGAARSWHGRHRHTSLVMAAAVFLAKLAADLRRAASGKRNETSPATPIAA